MVVKVDGVDCRGGRWVGICGGYDDDIKKITYSE